jgi:hypothetical protein
LFILILSVFIITGCNDGGGSGSGNSDTPVTINPVSSTEIVDGATGVPINHKLAVTFSEEMDPATINATTFTLYDGATAVSGTVTYSGVTAVFRPTADLDPNTTYIATITTGVENLAGNSLANDYVWSFTTDAAADATAPIIALTVPANLETGIAINTKITATFSEAMDPSTIDTATFTMVQGIVPVSGAVTYAGLVATFTPTDNLADTTTYTATITTTAEDLNGNALAANKVWTFDTGAVLDTTAPTVTLTGPVDLATGAALNKKVQATFSEAMDPLTITTATFTLKQGATAVPGTVAYVGLVATFTPTDLLSEDLTYTATIKTGAKDLAGNALVVPAAGGLPKPNPWTFTTVDVLPIGPLPVDLGTAGNFVLLTKTGITTTGVTAITGDMGVSPIGSTAITGFGLAMDATGTFSTSGLVTGNVYAADYTAPTPANLTAAISDMAIAYSDAAGRTIPDFTELGAGDISGMDLAPGLYKWGTGLLIDSTGVTLTGGADDVWIFQIADDLTVNNAAIVTLAGGAQAKNIFWQVAGGTGVALGTTVQFKGIILAEKAITFDTGATLVNGRALAKSNVTLDANTITAP